MHVLCSQYVFMYYVHMYMNRYDGKYNLIKRVRTVVDKLPKMKDKDKQKKFLPLAIPHAITPSRKKRKSPVPPASSSINPTLTPFEAQPHPLFDPDAPYVGYIHPSRRMCQSLPPDPPTPLVTPRPQDHSSTVPLLNQPQRASTPPPSPSSRLHPLLQSPMPCRMPCTTPPSPTSPAPSVIPPTPHASQTSNLSQTSCPPQTSYAPTSRDYSDDYENVIRAVAHLHRLNRFLFPRRGVGRQSHDPDPTVTREDVIEVLAEVREMLNRLFNRLNDSCE